MTDTVRKEVEGLALFRAFVEGLRKRATKER